MQQGADDAVFLSVIAWPQDATRDDMVALVGEQPGTPAPGERHALTPETVRLRVGLRPPMIIGLTDRRSARAACERIRDHGGDAFACSMGDLEALGPTLKIKELGLVDGEIDLALWRGPSARVRRENLFCLVRAHLSETSRVRLPAQREIRPPVSAAGVMGLGFPVRLTDVASTRSTKTTTSDKLDIHTTDGSVFQLDGDKFGYNILGDMKGHSDNENMDRMFELFQHIAPHAIADMYYSVWAAPPGYHRLRLPGAAVNREDPAFAFYSRWCALMYRHLTRD